MHLIKIQTLIFELIEKKCLQPKIVLNAIKGWDKIFIRFDLNFAETLHVMVDIHHRNQHLNNEGSGHSINQQERSLLTLSFQIMLIEK